MEKALHIFIEHKYNAYIIEHYTYTKYKQSITTAFSIKISMNILISWGSNMLYYKLTV